MRIAAARRISQGFFLAVFLWFCVAAAVGPDWWQLRGWPVNWFLSMDPLTALSTLLATHTLAPGLLWALAVAALTAFLGRFFCGFVCPMGTLNHLVGWLSNRSRPRVDRAMLNAHRPGHSVKLLILAAMLACAAAGSVQTGLLDPLPLLHRSVNLAILPLADARTGVLSDEPRLYQSVWLIGGVLLAILALNMLRPRFFCRFVCPLGGLFSLLARFAPWRIGKADDGKCGDCRLCEEHCEGGCRPSGEIVSGDCVLCMNCLSACPAGRIGWSGQASAAGEKPLPDVSRRALITAVAAGAAAAPLWGAGALAGPGRDPSLIRPPGSLDESRFLDRCIRCGQCMRACPSNIIQPDIFRSGIQGLWTPALDFRMGRSGCQVNCITCGQVCPTAAIRPLSLEEKHGAGDFKDHGPVRLGTAFVDRARCLPWVMDRPCIVCQEVCPVSPKAIYTKVVFETVRDGRVGIAAVRPDGVDLAGKAPSGINLGSGDYAIRPESAPDSQPRRIVGSDGSRLVLDRASPGQPSLAAGDKAHLLVRLQRPFIDPSRCIGCGMCEHDCPVSGLRAVRVYSENESRSRSGKMTI